VPCSVREYSLRIVYDSIRFLLQRGLRCAPGDVMSRRMFGVSIGGIPWQVGRHCLYLNGADSDTRLGVVDAMISGMDNMEDPFVIFQVVNKPRHALFFTARVGHYCLFSNDSQTTEFVLWTQITWICKIFKVQGANMALPYASCTSRELVTFD
jgi:hypothetical protein